jgi:tyrosyl-tRNA synthetase
MIKQFSTSQLKLPIKASFLLSEVGLCSTHSEGKRLMLGHVVSLNKDLLSDLDLVFNETSELIGKTLKVGKKKSLMFID